MKLIYENIQWIFSGAGVIIITFIFNRLINKRKQNSHTNGINIQKANHTKVINNEDINVNVKKSSDVLIKGNKNGKR